MLRRIKMLSPAARLLVAAAVALAASGGFGLFQSATSSSPQTSLPDSFDPVAVADPLESFPDLPLASLSTPDQDRRLRIQQAIEKLAAECMADEGFEFETLGFDPTPTRNRYGLVDPTIAEEHGYQDPDTEVYGDGPPGLSDDPEFVHALVGDQAAGGHEVEVTAPSGEVIGTYFRDGCLWDGEQAIWGDWAAYEADRSILQQVNSAALAEALRAEPVVAAMDEWSSCMADAGYEVADREALDTQLLPEVRSGDGEGGPSSAERALAVADASCNLSAGLQTAWYEADVAAQTRLLADSPVAPADLEAKLDAADMRAREVLSS